MEIKLYYVLAHKYLTNSQKTLFLHHTLMVLDSWIGSFWLLEFLYNIYDIVCIDTLRYSACIYTWRIHPAYKFMRGEEYGIFMTKILLVTMVT